MTDTRYTRTFKQLGKHNIPSVGGKGANLGEMTTGNFPVPPGFVLTTNAYNAFVQVHGLQKQIVQAASSARAGDSQSSERAADAIRQLFLDAEIPDDVAQALLTAYAALDADTVAVRSSATAEDLPEASFAGQQETYLNVQGAEALLEAVKQCWASLWTARAIAYREHQGVAHTEVSMAVVVQTMVPAEVSGILFTANPTTGARDELVVNAGFGLGDAIVAGEVTPDTYVVDRESLTTKETRLGTKEVMSVAGARDADVENTKPQPVPEAQRGQPALAESLLGELAALGIQVEELFEGAPQDIEWAVADGRIWLLQARPITNLPPAPLQNVRWKPPIPGTVWMRRQVVEHMPEPLSPLFAELYLREGLTRSIEVLMTFMSDLTDPADISKLLEEAIPGSFAITMNGYAYSVASFNFRWNLVAPMLRIYATVVPKMIRHLQPYWRDQAVPAYLSTIDEWKRIDATDASDEELLRGVRQLAEAEAIYWFAAAIPLGLARVMGALLDRFLKSVAGAESATGAGLQPTSGAYLRGFPTKALEAQIELEAIAEKVRASDELREQIMAMPAGRLLDVLAEHSDGQPMLDDLQDYLDEYGHQIYNLDFAVPTLADEPLPVLLSLKAAVEHPERDARTRHETLARERDRLVERTESILNPVQRRIFRLLLGWAQRYTPYREEALFYLGAAWPTLRALALELGRRLTAAGSLEDADDVFYLTSEELAAASESRADGVGRPGLARLAQQRRELREARKRLNPPVSVPPNATLQFGPIRMTMFEPQPAVAGEGPTLSGFAVSPDIVTGTASVIRSPQEFDRMVPDTILVCTTTTPAWTPLFAQARGLVTDIGGALAHGSIVAREYGIPAVMGTGVATQRIQSGMRIRIDGDAGTVTLLDEVDGAEERQPATKDTYSNVAKKTLLTLAVAAIALVVWWKKRRRSSNLWWRGNNVIELI